MKRLFADTVTHTIVDYNEIDFAHAWAGRYFEIISSKDENFVRETWAVTPDSNTPGIDYLGITMDMDDVINNAVEDIRDTCAQAYECNLLYLVKVEAPKWWFEKIFE